MLIRTEQLLDDFTNWDVQDDSEMGVLVIFYTVIWETAI